MLIVVYFWFANIVFLSTEGLAANPFFRLLVTYTLVCFSISIDVEDRLIGMLDYLTSYEVRLDGFNIW